MRDPSYRSRAGVFALVLALFPRVADAQAMAMSFEDLQRTLKEGQRVVVTDESGQAVKGRVDRVATSSITVGGRILTEQTVAEIRLPDPVWNGALIGAAIGAGLATWDYTIDPSEPGNAAIFTVAIGLGAAIGAGIDRLVTKGGKLLYASTRQTATVTALPLLDRNRQGALVAISF